MCTCTAVNVKDHDPSSMAPRRHAVYISDCTLSSHNRMTLMQHCFSTSLSMYRLHKMLMLTWLSLTSVKVDIRLACSYT